MNRLNFTTIIIWLAAFCSITGVTIWSIVSPLLQYPNALPYVLLALGVFGLLWVGVMLQRRLRESRGIIVSRKARPSVSRNFAASTLRSIDIFAGDLSWLETDIEVYKTLRDNGVAIRVLTDTPNAAAIAAGKAHGIQFRQYPGKMNPPIKASISDADEETECRALVVKRRTPRARPRQREPYRYWMKFYHGSPEYPVINAMATLFEELYSRGIPL